MSHAAINVEILPIAEAYIEGFHQCLDSVARERAYLAFVEAPPLEAVREFVLSNIAQDVPQFVALHSSVVIGWCDILPASLPGFRHCGRLGMGVRQDYRSLGIGKKLLMATLNQARERELERVELEVYVSNQPAIELYQKAGFVVEGIKKKGRKLDGVYEDVMCMALLFE
jgi:ribosomal protein S18 acetylase RimI-like enzyme